MGTLTIQTPRVFKPLLYPARYKGAHGGRGSGKSHHFADDAIDYALTHPGARIACIREVQKSLQQSVKRLLEDKIASYGLGSEFRVQNTQVITPGGGLIIFAGMQEHTAESIKSLEGFDIAWVEEAQSFSQRSLDILRPTIRKEGSEIWFSWNPRYATDPVDVFLRSSDPPPGAVVVKANFTDNPWFPKVLQTDMEYDRRRDIEMYQHVWEGDYEKNSEARVFKNWVVEEFEVPHGVALLHGGDWGFSQDPTVGIRSFVQGRRLMISHEAYRVGVEIDHSPALFDTLGCTAQSCVVAEALARGQSPLGLECDAPGHGSARKWTLVADSARPETISYVRRNGYPRIEAAVKGPNSVDEGIAFLKTYDIVVHPRCVQTIKELTNYKYKVDPMTGEVTPVLVDKDNHVIDALRYSAEKMRRRRKVGGFVA